MTPISESMKPKADTSKTPTRLKSSPLSLPILENPISSLANKTNPASNATKMKLESMIFATPFYKDVSNKLETFVSNVKNSGTPFKINV